MTSHLRRLHLSLSLLLNMLVTCAHGWQLAFSHSLSHSHSRSVAYTQQQSFKSKYFSHSLTLPLSRAGKTARGGGSSNSVVAAAPLYYPDRILEVPTTVSISIENSFKASIDFTLLGNPYTFSVTNWQSRGFRRFIELFHDTTPPRDVAMFGAIIEKQDGSKELIEDMTDVVRNPDGTYTVGLSMKPMTVTQKLNAIEQGCKDVIKCLNIIGATHKRSVLEYCVWYTEKHHNYDTYASYITMVTSHCVVHCNFMAPSERWQLVEFFP